MVLKWTKESLRGIRATRREEDSINNMGSDTELPELGFYPWCLLNMWLGHYCALIPWTIKWQYKTNGHEESSKD